GSAARSQGGRGPRALSAADRHVQDHGNGLGIGEGRMEDPVDDRAPCLVPLRQRQEAVRAGSRPSRDGSWTPRFDRAPKTSDDPNGQDLTGRTRKRASSFPVSGDYAEGGDSSSSSDPSSVPETASSSRAPASMGSTSPSERFSSWMVRRAVISNFLIPD